MGLLRILLAISVFCAHSRPLGSLRWLSGDLAVESFFVISGFYMQLILSTKYTKERLGNTWVWQFYKARYLRLLPVYWVGCLLALGSALIWPQLSPFPVWTYLQTLVNSPGNLLFKAYLGFTNLTILFQELVMFLASTHGHVHWAADFWKTDLPLYQGLLIPQGWTLGIELSFYIIAPFLLKWRSRWLALVALFSLILKLVVVLQLHLGDPWNHRLFPIELGYFVVGALAFRNRAKLDWLIPKRVGKYVVYLLAIGFATMKAPVPLATLVYPLTLALLLPSMFRLTGSDKADRWIGELSYPFYIFHLLSIVIVRVALQRGWQTIEWAWAGLFLTLILSAVALVVEERYLEPWRSRFGQRPAAATTLTSREKRVERAAATAG